MDLDELRAVQTRERATDGLQDLRDSFYADVASYIQDLRDERDRAAAESDDPFGDPRVSELSEEIESAEQVAEAIYERRIGKLVKQASLAAAGMPDDQQGLTTEERDLYTDLVARIKENKQGVLDIVAGDAPIDGSGWDSATERSSDDTAGDEAHDDPSAPDGPPPNRPPERAEAEGTTAADAMGGDLDEASPSGTSPSAGESSTEHESTDGPAAESSGEMETHSTDADAGSAPDDVDRMTVRVTSDVGEIFGVDEREYSLYEDDVVQLPEENAEPLIQRNAAEKLE